MSYNYFTIKKISKGTSLYHGTHYDLNKIFNKLSIRKKLFFELKPGIYNPYIYITPRRNVAECYSFRKIILSKEKYKIPIIFNLKNINDLLFLDFEDNAPNLSIAEGKKILQQYDGLYRKAICPTDDNGIAHNDYALFNNYKLQTIGYSVFLNKKWSKNLLKKELIDIIYNISL